MYSMNIITGTREYEASHGFSLTEEVESVIESVSEVVERLLYVP